MAFVSRSKAASCHFGTGNAAREHRSRSRRSRQFFDRSKCRVRSAAGGLPCATDCDRGASAADAAAPARRAGGSGHRLWRHRAQSAAAASRDLSLAVASAPTAFLSACAFLPHVYVSIAEGSGWGASAPTPPTDPHAICKPACPLGIASCLSTGRFAIRRRCRGTTCLHSLNIAASHATAEARQSARSASISTCRCELRMLTMKPASTSTSAIMVSRKKVDVPA